MSIEYDKKYIGAKINIYTLDEIREDKGLSNYIEDGGNIYGIPLHGWDMVFNSGANLSIVGMTDVTGMYEVSMVSPKCNATFYIPSALIKKVYIKDGEPVKETTQGGL